MIKICQIFNISADYFYFHMDKELMKKESEELDSLMILLKTCDKEVYSKIYRIIKIMLESPAA